MELKKAINLGFVKGSDGFWRRPITQNKRGGIYQTWQKYFSKKCIRCKNDFLASHANGEFCSNRCQSTGNSYCKGIKFNRKKSDRINQHGYWHIYLPNHPQANKKGYVAEHRYVGEKKIGRLLQKYEHAHHINGDRSDNRSKNIIVLTASEHNSHHKSEEIKNRKRDKLGRLI